MIENLENNLAYTVRRGWEMPSQSWWRQLVHCQKQLWESRSWRDVMTKANLLRSKVCWRTIEEMKFEFELKFDRFWQKDGKINLNKIGLLLCHSHIELRLRLRLIPRLRLIWGWGWVEVEVEIEVEVEMMLNWSLVEVEFRLSWVGVELRLN